MILVLDKAAEKQGIAKVLEELHALGLEGRLLESGDKPLIHVTRGQTKRARKLLGMEAVQAIVPTSGPRIRRHGRRFYPYHFIGWSAAALVLSGVLVFLSGQWPPGLGETVDSLAAPQAAEAALPWFLRAPVEIVERMGALGWSIVGLGLVVLFALPWIDRSRGTGLARRWPFLILGLALAAAYVFVGFGGGH